MISIIKQENGHAIALDGKAFALIPAMAGATDTFEIIEEGAWRWHRHTDAPTDHMRMEVILLGEPTFTMIPAVSYNGNGWGNYPEYVGDYAEDGTPWSFASHRSTIPACTYSENDRVSLSLMSMANDNTACSLYQCEDGKHHVVIFPEQEKPKTLQRHFWGEPFQGTMEPRQDFDAILQCVPSDGSRHRYKYLLDFAFRFYGHPVTPAYTAEQLLKLGIAYCHFLYQRDRDGMAGFTTGSAWNKALHGYEKQLHRYEPGWVGQSTSMANAFIWQYTRTGDKLLLDMALEAHDAWIRFGMPRKGLMYARVDRGDDMFLAYDDSTAASLDPWIYNEDKRESILGRIQRNKRGELRKNPDGSMYVGCNAADLGTSADGYFEAYDLLQKAGIDKPEYLQIGLDVCEFALTSQAPSGIFAKSWDHDGSIMAQDGTIGVFMCLPLLNGYHHTKDKRYLESAERAFRFYYQELEDYGFTTAGALDTYSIDKESASPLLRVCLRLYDVTQDPFYVEAAEKIGWYLATWMMHFTVEYPKDTILGQMGVDTFGFTSVSTPHSAVDQYALRDVLSFKRLYELTGNVQWLERAKALWYGANQCISDGTLVVNERLRPAGSQDEAIFHTRWGRKTVPPFMPSQWLPAWPCGFRLENLRWHDDWSFFDEGLPYIEGHIE